MALEYLSEFTINNFIALALAEDVGDGDHSSLACIPREAQGEAVLIAKDHGILAGVNLAEKIFLKVDSTLKFVPHFNDGSEIADGNVLFTVTGSVQSILTAERLALNCMQRMSGIATLTKSMVSLIEGTKARLLDTRKTTPNFRPFEKWAVIIGGGVNHRYNLSDMVMLKDNHIDFAGGVDNAVMRTIKYLEETGRDLKIEVEVRSLEELQEALNVGHINRIMLDNMTVDDMREAVRKVNGTVELEASGGITEHSIRAIAETGVDYISVGALTHSYKSLDMSLKKRFDEN